MGLLTRLFARGAAARPETPRLEVAPGRSAVGIFVPLPPAGPERQGEIDRLTALDGEIRAAVSLRGHPPVPAAALPGRSPSRLAGVSPDGAWWLSVYEGDDLGATWVAVASKLESRPFPRGSFAIKRDGLSGDEERVRIEWDG